MGLGRVSEAILVIRQCSGTTHCDHSRDFVVVFILCILFNAVLYFKVTVRDKPGEHSIPGEEARVDISLAKGIRWARTIPPVLPLAHVASIAKVATDWPQAFGQQNKPTGPFLGVSHRGFEVRLRAVEEADWQCFMEGGV